jgi:hypothetical protein
MLLLIYRKVQFNVLSKLFGRYPEFFSKNFKVLYSKYIYHVFTGKFLNLKNPKNISEKLMWLKLFYKNQLIPLCTDKYLVREYIEDKGFSHILNELYNVYDSVEDINFDKLPNQFVLKATHGCGYNIICKDKIMLNIAEAKQKLNIWMNSVYGLKSGEWHYSEIKPKIICEKYLNHFESSTSVIDYKINCFNGKPFCFVIGYNRTEKSAKFSSYNLHWQRIDFLKEEGDDLPPPKNLALMIQVASVLSGSFPFVRVDFYEIEGILYFGELTFTPMGGMMIPYKDEIQDLLGEQLVLPKKNRSRIPFLS